MDGIQRASSSPPPPAESPLSAHLQPSQPLTALALALAPSEFSLSNNAKSPVTTTTATPSNIMPSHHLHQQQGVANVDRASSPSAQSSSSFAATRIYRDHSATCLSAVPVALYGTTTSRLWFSRHAPGHVRISSRDSEKGQRSTAHLYCRSQRSQELRLWAHLARQTQITTACRRCARVADHCSSSRSRTSSCVVVWVCIGRCIANKAGTRFDHGLSLRCCSADGQALGAGV
ncbi:hypothetical protein BCR44DRAFT_1194548 [Catenaria anguillulae PL171]|uniref:Uncharacterized protein n=1 Tax=Catenaria anguillulae PL171 TaxID=765915 RepID=A0A1Y2HGG3_9FUNG|nr:hypothetical protein BCR44DRAFT_1194548 [Catenaria anguillulae PL171]